MTASKYHRDETFDLVNWYKLNTPLPRFRVKNLNDYTMSSMKLDPSLINVIPYFDKAINMGVKYLEFTPGEEERKYRLAEVTSEALPYNLW